MWTKSSKVYHRLEKAQVTRFEFFQSKEEIKWKILIILHLFYLA